MSHPAAASPPAGGGVAEAPASDEAISPATGLVSVSVAAAPAAVPPVDVGAAVLVAAVLVEAAPPASVSGIVAASDVPPPMLPVTSCDPCDFRAAISSEHAATAGVHIATVSAAAAAEARNAFFIGAPPRLLFAPAVNT
jgi:hypothetical protein